MNKKRIQAFLLALALATAMPTAHAEEATQCYSISIPTTVTATEGWNDIGITVRDGNEAFPSGKRLAVEASSDWRLVSGDNSVGYLLKGSEGGDTVTEWEFTSGEINEGTTKDMGIQVEGTSQLPPGTYTGSVTFMAKAADPTDLSTISADYVAQDGETLTGILGSKVKISIANDATVTLRDVEIIGSNEKYGNGTGVYLWAGITCLGNATIILEGENKVKGFYELFPGIYVPEGSTLTIGGSGSLDSSSNGYAAGIGSGYYSTRSCGNITIKGGTITAKGGEYAAGIGSGGSSSCGDIAITGGTVVATGGKSAAGIGSSDIGSCGDIAITGGTVKATGGKSGAGIGAGYGASCGNIAIAGGTVEATGGFQAAGIGTGYRSSFTSITIANTVGSVTATRGAGSPCSIGNGTNPMTSGTVTIGGVEGSKSESPYTYTGNGSGSGSGGQETGPVEIAKQTVVCSITLVVTWTDDQKPTAKTGLEYTGEPQPLVSGPTTPRAGVTVKYNIDGQDWDSAIPTGKDAGDYTVKVKYFDASDSLIFDGEPISVTINKKPAPELTDSQKPAAKENLAYSGDPQELVNGPSDALDGYTMMYALGSDASPTNEFTETIPKATDIGAYYVWYKATGDDNHADTVPACLEVTIEDVPRLKSATPMLDGKLGIVIAMELPEIGGVDYNDSKMEFNVDGNKREVAYDASTVGEDGERLFPCALNALELDKVIHTVFHYGDGKSVEFDVNASEILGNAGEGLSEEQKKFIEATENYGYYAKLFLDGGQDEIEAYTAADYAEAKAALGAYKATRVSKGRQIGSPTYSLALGSQTSLIVYFEAKATPVTVKVDGILIDDDDVQDAEGGRKKVVISGIAAKDLGNARTVVITAGNSKLTLKASPLSYANEMINTNDKASKDFATSIYKYWEAAPENTKE